MKRGNPKEEIIEILARFPQGASIEELMLVFAQRSKRTVQRWFAELLQTGQVEAVGEARARRYRLIPKIEVTHVSPDIPIPLSEEAMEIQKFTIRPISARPLVSYNRDWLEEYRPNETGYLSETMRKKLRALGEVEKEEYPAGTFAEAIFARLLVDLSWNSSRLEGNTYSFLDTERLIQWGDMPPGKDLKETQMILNHKAAIEFLIRSAKEIGINRYTILNLHTLLSDNLMSDPVFSGRLRVYPVGIAHSTYIPLAVPQVIEECFNRILEKANLIRDPFEQAFFLMVHIPYLQPFEDVNKRTSRLAANIPFIRNNLRPLSFVEVPEQLYINGLLGVYELNRMELLREVFIWAYERSCARYVTTRHSLGEPDPFRLRYRKQIMLVVRKIVELCLNRDSVLQAIEKEAKNAVLPQDERRFVQLVEKELAALHEGNIARYQIEPSSYAKWKRHGQG